MALPQRILTKIGSYDDILATRMRRVNLSLSESLEHRDLRRILLDKYRDILYPMIEFVNDIGKNSSVPRRKQTREGIMLFEPKGNFDKEWAATVTNNPSVADPGRYTAWILDPQPKLYILGQFYIYNEDTIRGIFLNRKSAFEDETVVSLFGLNSDDLNTNIDIDAANIHNDILLLMWNNILSDLSLQTENLSSHIHMLIELISIVSKFNGGDSLFFASQVNDTVTFAGLFLHHQLAYARRRGTTDIIEAIKLFDAVQRINPIDKDILFTFGTYFAATIRALGLFSDINFKTVCVDIFIKSAIPITGEVAPHIINFDTVLKK
jgi:hypothetical protein